MMTLNISGKDYNVKFGYNNFCDSDLLDRVEDMMNLLNGSGVKTDKDVSNAGKMRDLFIIVRELLFEGFKKMNPVENVQEVGDLLDTYMDETPKAKEGGEPEEERGVFALFLLLSNELMSEGFLADLMTNIVKISDAVKESQKKPQDHKKKVVKIQK